MTNLLGFHLQETPRVSKSMQRKQTGGSQRLRGGEVGRDASWAGLPLEVLKVSWNLIEVTVSQHSECSKYNLTVPFKVVNLMLCELYLNEERML